MNQTGNIETVKTLLGHSDIQLTSRYYLATQDETLKSAVNGLEQTIVNAKNNT